VRHYETTVQKLKDEVLTAVARLAWNERLQSNDLLNIPEEIIPGPEAQMRCCIYKERAVVTSRVKMAMGGDRANPALVEVLPIACDECPVTEISVGASCRGCIAHRCMDVCPKGAIRIENHRSVIDHSKCILCGKCIEACPYGAITKNMRPCERGCPVKAISMGPDRKANIDVNKCISCGQCVIQCPFGAVMDKSYIVDVIQMLLGADKWGLHVYAILAPSFVGQFDCTPGQMAAALKEIGFYDVAEVALGADLTAQAEAAEFEERGGGPMTSSCCPAFVAFVERHMPDQVPLVSTTPSPMVMLGRNIKDRDPLARVVFIGPCVAKKREFHLGRTRASVDLVLTFEELYSMLSAKEIDVTKMKEIPLDHASGFGRSFAAGGGVAAAVGQALRERGSAVEAKPIACSGIEECKMALIKMSKGVLPENFIEGMACMGGCVQGPAVLNRSPKNKNEVAKHAKQAGERTIADAVNGIGGLSEVPAESSDKKPGGAVEKARAEAATQA
jgi:[FeFe] hydrogenase (group B1/B3)